MTCTGSWAWRGGGGRGQKSCHREKANLYDETNYATSRLGDDRTGLGSGEAGGRATQSWARTTLVAARGRR